MPVMMKRVEGDRVREVCSAYGKIWACYARSGGACYKPDGISCPCDGWEPFLSSWCGIVDAIEEQLRDDIADRPEWLSQITDDEHDRLCAWLDTWRIS